MICRRCAVAGSMTKEAREIDTVKVKKGLVSLAKVLHTNCLFPGCTCQHKENMEFRNDKSEYA